MGLFSHEEPDAVTIQGKPLSCQICQNGRFWTKKAQLHSGFATFFNFEWASPTCICVICSSCGYVHWFFPED